jgi:hypothetical protein
MKEDMASRVEEGADVGDGKVVQELVIIGRQGCLDPVYALCLVRISLAFHHAWHSTSRQTWIGKIRVRIKYFAMLCLVCLLCLSVFCAMSHKGSSIYPPKRRPNSGGDGKIMFGCLVQVSRDRWPDHAKTLTL